MGVNFRLLNFLGGGPGTQRIRKLEKAVAAQNSLQLEKFSDSPFFRQHEMLSLPRFGHFPARKMAAGKSAPPSCYPCQGLGIFRQGKRLLENRPRLLERSWIFSSKTATAFLSFSEETRPKKSREKKIATKIPEKFCRHFF